MNLLHMITKYGNIYDTNKDKIVEQTNHNGYQVVMINHAPKLINILVANTFAFRDCYL